MGNSLTIFGFAIEHPWLLLILGGLLCLVPLLDYVEKRTGWAPTQAQRLGRQCLVFRALWVFSVTMALLVVPSIVALRWAFWDTLRIKPFGGAEEFLESLGAVAILLAVAGLLFATYRRVAKRYADIVTDTSWKGLLALSIGPKSPRRIGR